MNHIDLHGVKALNHIVGGGLMQAKSKPVRWQGFGFWRDPAYRQTLINSN